MERTGVRDEKRQRMAENELYSYVRSRTSTVLENIKNQRLIGYKGEILRGGSLVGWVEITLKPPVTAEAHCVARYKQLMEDIIRGVKRRMAKLNNTTPGEIRVNLTVVAEAETAGVIPPDSVLEDLFERRKESFK